MGLHRKVARSEDVNIMRRYDVDLDRMEDIARDYGVSRQAIYKILRRNGVDTSKRRIDVTCDACGETTRRTRGQLRGAIHVFCSNDCYHAYLNAVHTHYSWRQGSRRARKIVEEAGFQLSPGQIVHHKDGNPWNNDISNLVVVANQGDHVRLHRGAAVPVLWMSS